MTALSITLTSATLLCTLVAGFLFAFAIVVMPGLGDLDDREFLQTFQAMDRVIQNNQPIFVLVWVGSVVTLLAATAIAFTQPSPGGERLLLSVATLLYLLGVQGPTIAINLPLNRELQSLEVAAMDWPSRRAARAKFETRWNRSNQTRTVFAVLVAALLIAG